MKINKKQLAIFVGFLFLISNLFLIYPIKAVNFNDIIINEIMYDLPGSDDGHEWIEIKNISGSEISLQNWRFNDGSNHLLNEPPKNGGQGSLKIPAGGYAILADDATIFLQDHPGFQGTVIDTVMSLNNTSGVLKIIDDTGQIIDQIQYSKNLGAAGDGYSLERKNPYLSDFCPSKNIGGSPASANNPNCPFSSPTPSFSPDPTPFSSIPKLVQVGEILITELMVNPSSNENEWIEIYNRTNRDIDLTGLTIEDNTGPTYGTGRGKTSLDGLIIPAYSYLVLTAGQNFNFNLNNSGDIVILKRDNLIIDQVAYGDFEDGNLNDNAPKPAQGIALARSPDLIDTDWDQADFHLTSQPTPGSPNLILEKNTKEDEKDNENELEKNNDTSNINQPTPSPSVKSVPIQSPEESPQPQTPLITNLSILRDLEKGTAVRVQGVVIVEPGILNKTTFYINGLQIYCYKQDFPKLKLGDRIEVNGTLSEVNGEMRLKIKNKNDIKILDQESISPQIISTDQISDELAGRLVSLKGQVIEKNGSRVYLDDGNGEALIYFKDSTGISKKEIKEGDYLSVIGIISRGKQDWQILPRYQNDLKIFTASNNVELKSESQPTINENNLTPSEEEINLAVNQKLSQNNLSKQLSSIGNLLTKHLSSTSQYLIMTAITLFAFLVALLIKVFL